MNAMPPMARHQSAAPTGIAGRGHARAGEEAEAFDIVMAEVGRRETPADETDAAGRIGADDEPIAADAGETTIEPPADPAAGILPLLRSVLPREPETRTTAGDVPAADAQTAGLDARPRSAEPAPPAKDVAARPAADLAAPADTTAAAREPRPEAGASSKPDRPSTNASRAAVESAPGKDAADEPLRRVSSTATAVAPQVATLQATTPQAAGGAAASSTSLSLLARLNLMSAQTGRPANTQAGALRVEAPVDEAAFEDTPSLGDTAPDDRNAEKRVRPMQAGDEASDGAAGRRDAADGTGRAAERAAPVLAVLPQTAQPAGVTGQVVEALGSNAAAIARAQTSIAAGNGEAPAGKAVQSLKIQLKPHDLGQVTAKLTMNGDQLSIEIEVDTIEAHRMLSNESDSIVKALRALGIAVDQVTIQQPPQANPAGRDGAGADANAFTGRGARDSGNSSNQDGRNPEHNSSDRDHGQEMRSTAESNGPGARSTGGVYI